VQCSLKLEKQKRKHQSLSDGGSKAMPKCLLCGMDAADVCLPDNTEFEKLDCASPII
jgi:hypothetical protein